MSYNSPGNGGREYSGTVGVTTGIGVTVVPKCPRSLGVVIERIRLSQSGDYIGNYITLQ